MKDLRVYEGFKLCMQDLKCKTVTQKLCNWGKWNRKKSSQKQYLSFLWRLPDRNWKMSVFAEYDKCQILQRMTSVRICFGRPRIYRCSLKLEHLCWRNPIPPPHPPSVKRAIVISRPTQYHWEQINVLAHKSTWHWLPQVWTWLLRCGEEERHKPTLFDALTSLAINPSNLKFLILQQIDTSTNFDK